MTEAMGFGKKNFEQMVLLWWALALDVPRFSMIATELTLFGEDKSIH